MPIVLHNENMRRAVDQAAQNLVLQAWKEFCSVAADAQNLGLTVDIRIRASEVPDLLSPRAEIHVGTGRIITNPGTALYNQKLPEP